MAFSFEKGRLIQLKQHLRRSSDDHTHDQVAFFCILRQCMLYRCAFRICLITANTSCASKW